jgi:hypothetical protein
MLPTVNLTIFIFKAIIIFRQYALPNFQGLLVPQPFYKAVLLHQIIVKIKEDLLSNFDILSTAYIKLLNDKDVLLEWDKYIGYLCKGK